MRSEKRELNVKSVRRTTQSVSIIGDGTFPSALRLFFLSFSFSFSSSSSFRLCFPHHQNALKTPCGSGSGPSPHHASASSTLCTTSLIVCFRTSTDQSSTLTVSNIMLCPRWHRVSSAYPACAHGEPNPVQVPCGMGSALWYTCVVATGSCDGGGEGAGEGGSEAGGSSGGLCDHGKRKCGRCQRLRGSADGAGGLRTRGGGRGRWRREAARRSPGDSNVTAGRP